MQDEYGWERLDEYLLARLTRANLHGLRLRDMCERVLDGVYRFALGEEFWRLVIGIYDAGGEQQT